MWIKMRLRRKWLSFVSRLHASQIISATWLIFLSFFQSSHLSFVSKFIVLHFQKSFNVILQYCEIVPIPICFKLNLFQFDRNPNQIWTFHVDQKKVVTWWRMKIKFKKKTFLIIIPVYNTNFRQRACWLRVAEDWVRGSPPYYCCCANSSWPVTSEAHSRSPQVCNE